MMSAKRYECLFIGHAIERLGGMEMADEFFDLHASIRANLPAVAAYHWAKGGAVEKGAAIWFRFIAQPQIVLDRKIAKGQLTLDDLDTRR